MPTFSKMSIRLLVLFSAFFLIQLLWVTAGRVGYPFEIEWMEGGMLTHAIRLAEGQAIYAQPSTEFVPFFYTPGYPALLAAFGQIFGGVDFALARAVSLAATLITMWLLFQVVRRETDVRFGFIAVGLYAALFRTNGAFYDLARPDALYMALVFCGCILIYREVRWRGVFAASIVLSRVPDQANLERLCAAIGSLSSVAGLAAGFSLRHDDSRSHEPVGLAH